MSLTMTVPYSIAVFYIVRLQVGSWLRFMAGLHPMPCHATPCRFRLHWPMPCCSMPCLPACAMLAASCCVTSCCACPRPTRHSLPAGLPGALLAGGCRDHGCRHWWAVNASRLWLNGGHRQCSVTECNIMCCRLPRLQCWLSSSGHCPPTRPWRAWRCPCTPPACCVSFACMRVHKREGHASRGSAQLPYPTTPVERPPCRSLQSNASSLPCPSDLRRLLRLPDHLGQHPVSACWALGHMLLVSC